MSTAYLFPGQGSHAVGMGRNAADASGRARDLFAQADDILGFALSDLCFDGPLETLTSTENQQVALYVTSLATLMGMEDSDTDYGAPAFVAGHSLGEFSALTAAGSLDFAAGLRLVRRRGELMKEAGEKSPGSMAAVLGLDTATVVAGCNQIDGIVQVANDNCPGQIVVSGESSAVEAVLPILSNMGARKVVPLAITIAAHSPLMGTAAEAFAQAVAETDIADPTIPVIGNTTAAPLVTAADIRAELNAQLTGSVRWTESMTYLVNQGVDTIVEVGSGDVLQKLMKRVNRKVKRVAFK